MQRVSIGSRLLRQWMILVAVVVVAVAGFAVYRLNGIFGSRDVVSTPSGAANEIVPFNPKHVVMEVFGPPGTDRDDHLPGRERPAAAGRQRAPAVDL